MTTRAQTLSHIVTLTQQTPYLTWEGAGDRSMQTIITPQPNNERDFSILCKLVQYYIE